ncbi:MAG: hypothetical protein AAF988_04025, partial [Pseudomonadota bacterium]
MSVKKVTITGNPLSFAGFQKNNLTVIDGLKISKDIKEIGRSFKENRFLESTFLNTKEVKVENGSLEIAKPNQEKLNISLDGSIKDISSQKELFFILSSMQPSLQFNIEGQGKLDESMAGNIGLTLSKLSVNQKNLSLKEGNGWGSLELSNDEPLSFSSQINVKNGSLFGFAIKDVEITGNQNNQISTLILSALSTSSDETTLFINADYNREDNKTNMSSSLNIKKPKHFIN